MSETTATQLNLTRRKLRYYMFRLANEANGGAPADKSTDVRSAFEGLPAFKLAGGWQSFGKRWDIDGDLQIKVLDVSLLDRWNSECQEAAKPLPETAKPAHKPLHEAEPDVIYDHDTTTNKTTKRRRSRFSRKKSE